MEEKYRVAIPDFVHWQKQVKCQAACPIHTDAGRYVQLIAEGNYKEAFLVARSPNPFVSVCGRVCAAPCEDYCRRGSIDAPVAIRALKRFVTEKYGVESLSPDTQDELMTTALQGEDNTLAWHLPFHRRARRSEGVSHKVAVIGAGPAGLACAHDLAAIGYQVTVFEATHALGGMLRHGIPGFRLSRSVIEKEIGKILQLGVEVQTGAPLTKNFSIKELERQGFDAIFIGVGTQAAREMNVEGADADGIINAVDFLININNGYRVPLGRKVIVIGGGFVAFDAARTALRAALEQDEKVRPEDGTAHAALDAARTARRAGVLEIVITSLESFEEMPVLRTAQGKKEYDEAVREGIRFHTQRGVKRFTTADGKVRGVDLIGVKRTYDEKGRFDPIYDETVSEHLEAETVILAIGQRPKLDFLQGSSGLELTPAGTIKVNPDTLETSLAGVFAGGDVVFGPRNLIDAIANGKLAARSIDDRLRKTSSRPAVKLSIEKIATREYSTFAGYEIFARKAPNTIPIDRRTGIVEVETDYAEAEALEQARRCLLCHIQTIYNGEKCILCGACTDICPYYCLKLVPLEDVELEARARERLDSHYSFGEADHLSVMIKDDERCIRCGLCTVVCPTDAMTMERMWYAETETLAVEQQS
ncbi:MAG: 4Fe-4S dicluster domain-containing protein [Ignavibacteria bacterium]|nr:4Fe-4S dicluster domain-containing protein [Ignavibacteria bacterium]